MVLIGGTIACAQMGDPNASIPTPQPVYTRRMFGAYGRSLEASSVTFVSAAAQQEGIRERLGLRKETLPVRNTRAVGKKDMVLNDATPNVEVNPETYDIRADGELITCEPAEVLPMAQGMLIADSGEEILLDLPEATELREGDALLLEDGRHVAIRAAAEPLAEVRGEILARLAWHIATGTRRPRWKPAGCSSSATTCSRQCCAASARPSPISRSRSGRRRRLWARTDARARSCARAAGRSEHKHSASPWLRRATARATARCRRPRTGRPTGAWLA